MSESNQQLTPFEAGTLAALEGIGIALQKLSNKSGTEQDRLSAVLNALVKHPPKHLKDNSEAVTKWAQPLQALLLGAARTNESDNRQT